MPASPSFASRNTDELVVLQTDRYWTIEKDGVAGQAAADEAA
jgi:hypothetical protein